MLFSIFRIFIFQIVILVYLGLCFLPSCAQEEGASSETSTEEFLSSINVDLPPATLSCRTGGSLQEIFLKTPRFTTGGNAFFVDKVNREIALFERAIVENVSGDIEKITVDVYIKVGGVQREDLVDLLLAKKVVASRNSQVIFVMKVYSREGRKVYVYDGKDENGNPINAAVFTRIKKLGNITHEGQKFIAANGLIKIRLPIPPKLVAPDGTLHEVFEPSIGHLVCTGRKFPIHDFDLSDLQDAFDKTLVDEIVAEASSTGLDEEEDPTFDEDL